MAREIVRAADDPRLVPHREPERLRFMELGVRERREPYDTIQER